MATSPFEPPVSKLRPPNLRSGVVERHRLLDRLDASSAASLTVLLALLRARAATVLGRPAADVAAGIEVALTFADEHRFVRSLLLDSGPLDDALRDVLRRAASGSHREQLRQHLRARLPLPRTIDNPATPFSPSSRELEILRYLATGLSNREIAAELYISLNTMKTHVRSLYRRLGVTSRSQAVAAGRTRGVL